MKILVIVDMQNDFISGSLANPKGEDVVLNVVKEINKDYDYYALTRDTHYDDYLKTYEGINLPIEHCIINTEGYKIRKEIYDAVENTKKPHKMFDKRGFGSYSLVNELDIFASKIESITIVGLCSDICVITNALMLRAQFVNTPIYYVSNAMYATSDDNQEAAIKILNACQIYEKRN